MVPNWRPDWRDPKKYPDPDKTRLDQWAWEFLRRNEEYQQVWSQMIELHEVAHDPPPEGPGSSRIAREFKSRDTISSDVLRIFQQKFGIILPASPDQPRVPPKFLHHTVSGRDRPSLKFCPEEQSYEVKLSLEPGESLIVFNLAWPIDMQLERARACLKERAAYLRQLGDLQPMESANHVSKFQAYLRILDANSAGASQREMAAVIYPHLPNKYPDRQGENTVRHSLKRATYLCKAGYRLIAP
jgi:Uncharacterized conserved protein (DUF2285)/Family of unknown function (DUF6499)